MLNVPSSTHSGCSLELTILVEIFCDKSLELMATGVPPPVYANNCHVLLKLEFASVHVCDTNSRRRIRQPLCFELCD